MGFFNKGEIGPLKKFIRSVNNRIYRNKKRGRDEILDVVNDLIYKHSTPAGYVSAKNNQLYKMGKREAEQFLADVQAANDIMKSRELIRSLQAGSNAKDLWYAVDYAAKQGTVPDSDSVRAIVDSLESRPDQDLFREAFTKIIQVGSGSIGVSDFAEYAEDVFNVIL